MDREEAPVSGYVSVGHPTFSANYIMCRPAARCRFLNCGYSMRRRVEPSASVGGTAAARKDSVEKDKK